MASSKHLQLIILMEATHRTLDSVAAISSDSSSDSGSDDQETSSDSRNLSGC